MQSKPQKFFASKFDELYTPQYAVVPLVNILQPHIKHIWEPTAKPGAMNIVKVLRHFGYTVTATHLEDGVNFLHDIPDNFNDIDAIITNPPYSIKTKFIRRCIELNKPFALLIPIEALSGKSRVELYNQIKIQILVPNLRINFKDHAKTGNWQSTFWLGGNNIFIKDINFCKLYPKWRIETAEYYF